jgi:hypothetical protein
MTTVLKVAAKRQDFELHANRDHILEFTITNEAGAVVDLSALTAKWAFALSAKNAPVVTKSSPSGGILMTDPVNGVLQVTLDPADTVAYANGKVVFHELVLIDASSKDDVAAFGRLILLPTIIPETP